MESLTAKILRRSLEQQEIICVYEDDDDTEFWAAIVADFNEDLVIFRHYTKYGDSDGIHIRPVDDIGKITFDEDYTRAMNYLIHTTGIDTPVEFIPEISVAENWQSNVLNQYLNDNRFVVSLDTNGEVYRGFINEISESEVIIRELDGAGLDVGSTLISLCPVSSIRVNDRENVKRKQLYNWTKSL